MIWVDPGNIRFKISPIEDLAPLQAGEWDRERRHELALTLKHRAIFERFSEGKDWADTDLFREIYRRRFEEGGHVRGARTLSDLLDQYRTRVDGLYRAMKRDGFQLDNGRGRSYPLPSLLIGRDGEIFIGNQGNHRLAIAQLLGLRQIAGNVTCRHALA